MRKLIILIIAVFTSLHGFGQTSVSGNVSGTWNLAGSPYIITGDVDVILGTTLTIDPGVEVRFDGQFGLDVQGTSSSFRSIITYSTIFYYQCRIIIKHTSTAINISI